MLDYIHHLLLLFFTIIFIASFSFRMHMGTIIIQILCLCGIVYNAVMILGPAFERIIGMIV
jgi:hypothetical protein